LFRRHANRTVALCARQLAEDAHLRAGEIAERDRRGGDDVSELLLRAHVRRAPPRVRFVTRLKQRHDRRHDARALHLLRADTRRNVTLRWRRVLDPAGLRLAGRWIDLEGRHLSPQPAGRELAIVLLAKARPAELPDHELHAISLLVLVVPEALKDLQHGFGNPEDF